MKKITVIITFLTIIASAFIFNACEDDTGTEQTSGNLPEKFKVDIPDAISYSGQTQKADDDTISGNDIYGHLANFIAIGEGAADIIEEIIIAIGQYNLNQETDLTYIQTRTFDLTPFNPSVINELEINFQ